MVYLCGQMHPQSSSAPCSLSARVRTRHKLAGTGFSCTLQPFSPRGYGRARGMISYAPCTSLARVTADEGGGENFSNASSHATKGVNVQFFTFICNNADAITHIHGVCVVRNAYESPVGEPAKCRAEV